MHHHGIDKHEEIALHHELAPVYVERYRLGFWKEYYDQWNKYLVRNLPVPRDSIVLDAGCGVGTLIDILVERFDRVVGLDISSDMVEAVTSRHANVYSVAVGDAEALPFRDNTYDAVLCRGAIHHMPNVAVALEEISRVLKPGGYLLMCETCNDSFIFRSIRQLFMSAYTRVSDKIEKDHPSLRSPQLINLINRAGLTVSKLQRFGFIAYPLASMPEHVPVLKYVPFSTPLTRLLVGIDNLAARIPVIRSHGWAITVLAQKPSWSPS